MGIWFFESIRHQNEEKDVKHHRQRERKRERGGYTVQKVETWKYKFIFIKSEK